MFGLDMSAVDVFPADVTEEPEVIIEDETIDQLSDDERRTLSALNMTLREFVALKVRFDSAHGEITDFTDGAFATMQTLGIMMKNAIAGLLNQPNGQFLLDMLDPPYELLPNYTGPFLPTTTTSTTASTSTSTTTCWPRSASPTSTTTRA